LLPAAPALIFLFLLFALNSIEAPGGGAAGVKADPLMVGDALGPQTDQVIVKFDDALDMGTMSAAAQESLVQRMSAEAGAELEFVRPMSGGSYVYRLAEHLPAAEVETVSGHLEALPEIRLAEPDLILRADGRTEMVAAAPGGAAFEPDDPLYDHQWHYRYTPAAGEGVNLPPAWDVTTGSSSTVVAVIDTGITDHVEFQGRVLPGYDFIFSPVISNDGDGRDADAHDPGDYDPDGRCASGSSWHGTHVAGTIAASSNNGIGVAGVNWQAKILPVRVLGRCGGYTSDVLDGARWAAGLSVPGVPPNEHPADVLNLSLGGQRTCTVTEQAAYDAIAAAGKVVVVAAGNASQDALYHSPASCDRVITVAATDQVGDRAGFSNYGRLIEISAPGAGLILSTYNSGPTAPEGDSYAYLAGTSMATPHVTGVVSLLLGLHPDLTPEQVLARLQDNARDFLPGSTCTTALCGAGILDAAAAIISPVQPLETPALSEIANPTGEKTFSVQWTAVSGAQWYKVKENHDDSTWEPIYEGPATNLQRDSLPLGGYCYRVRAFNPQGYSEWSAIQCTHVGPKATATPTATPTRIQGALDPPTIEDIANPGGGATFNVQWTAVGGAEWYKVKENLSPSTAWKPIYEGPETILHRANLAGGDYCYRVRAFSDVANSDWSADKCVSVSSPTPTETPTPAETATSTGTATPAETAAPKPSGTPASTPTGEATPRPDHSLFIPLVSAPD
ncbi:MAG: S8 family serine peptidase, partial [Candidatus Promineifilaceae bacterium]